MANDSIIRAWKDPDYRSSLTAHEREMLPANPAGTIDEGKLAEVAGGMPDLSLFNDCTVRFCTHYFCSLIFSCPA
jgi:mersacidin/lichenicidin family type 2 lantibiotic